MRISKHQQLSERSLGLLYGIISAVSFGMMSFLAKFAAHLVPSTEIILARGSFGLLVLSPFVYRELNLFFKRGSLFLWLRCICGSAAVFCLFYNLRRTSVGDATALSNLSPFFVVLGSWLFLNESMHIRDWVGVLAVLAGVILLQSPFGSALPSGVMVVGLFGAFFGGAAYLALKQASKKFKPLLVVWGFCTFSCLTSFLIPGKSWVIPDEMGLLLLLGVGLFGLLGQVFMTYTYIYLPTAQASILNLSSVVWGMTIESIYHMNFPTERVIFCYLVILLGSYLLQTSPIRRHTK